MFSDVLFQANLCTSGGKNGVLNGKHYNRSWAVHECLSEVLHRLFIEKEKNKLLISDELKAMIQDSISKPHCE